MFGHVTDGVELLLGNLDHVLGGRKEQGRVGGQDVSGAALSYLLKFCDAVRHMDCGLVRLYDRSMIPHGYMGSFVLSLLGCALCSAL